MNVIKYENFEQTILYDSNKGQKEKR